MTDKALPDIWRAQIRVTDRFIYLESASGFILFVPDPDGYSDYLDPDVSDQVLGEALLKALAGSRVVTPGTEGDLYDEDRVARAYEAWVTDARARFGYKAKRALFKDMLYCSARTLRGEITIMPSRHSKLEAWTRLDEDQYVTMPATASAKEAGAALRLALSRCS